MDLDWKKKQNWDNEFKLGKASEFLNEKEELPVVTEMWTKRS